MADFQPDTSSYPKPSSGGSVLDTVGKLQGLESNALSIDQQKLKLVNDRYAIVNRELQGLMGEPDLSFDKVASRFQNLVNLGFMPSQMMAQSLKDVPTDKSQIPNWLQMKIKQGQSIVDAINYSYGAPQYTDNGQTLTPTRVSPQPGFGIRGGEGLPIQKQLPPNTPVIGSENEPRLLGPQPPQLAPGTVAGPSPINTSPLPVGPINNPAINGPSANFGGTVTGATVEPATRPSIPPRQALPVNPRIGPQGPATGLPPGVAEAQKYTGEASGQQLAQDRVKAASFQRDIFPLTEAIPALEALSTKGTGPGTETINHIKSFILSNVPGVKESDFEGLDNIKAYDKAKKYLTDFVNQTGNSGTNDKLAAAFAGNPSVSISNAAAVDVAKSALSLRRMQQAQLMEFHKLQKEQGLRDDQYSKWLANRNQELDPRAFGVDMMTPEARKKLNKQLEKNPKEGDRFDKSLELAHSLGFLTPNSSK